MKINIKKLREGKKITSQKLAKRLNFSAQYIGKIENTNNCSLKKLKEICLALEYSHKETAKIILSELNLNVELSSV
jgi:transcriptional regulator with XRE-family HTH domain